MFRVGVGALCLLLHVVYLQREYRQAVDGPCWALGVYACVGHYLHVLILVPEPTVYLLHEVCAVLVAAVYAALQQQSLCRVNLRVAYDILKVPLHGVYPALHIQAVLYRALSVGVVHLGVNVVGLVIVVYRPAENLVTKFGKCHLLLF